MPRKHSTRLSRAAEGGFVAAASGYYGEGGSPYHQEPIYRGLNVQLPPDVHARVHDPSRPVEERGLHLVRHLMTHPSPSSGTGVGRAWTREDWVPHLIHAEEEGGRPATHTPVVLHGLASHEDEDYAGGPDRWSNPETDLTFPHGHPVTVTGISWAHPEHDEPHYRGEEGYQHLNFPEPVHMPA